MAQGKMTERIVTVVITLVVTGIIGVIGSALVGGALIRELGGVQETEPALAERVADLELKTDKFVTKEVVADIVDTKIDEAMATLTDRIGALETVTIPRGVVIAFDRDDLNADECPPGWQPFKEARARVIVGAGDPSKAPGKYGYDEGARPLTHYVRGQHRGEEQHTLTIKEIPAHLHVFTDNTILVKSPIPQNSFGGTNDPAGGVKGSEKNKTDLAGGDGNTAGQAKPHNNMPPYIALYFCKKG